MGEIAPAVAADGAANGYLSIVTKFTALQKAAAGLFEHAEQIAQRMRANADSAVVVAELCAAAEADARHVAAVAEVGEAFGQVVGGCKRLLSSAEQTHQAATDVKAAHQAEYGPVHAAATASRARQAKPGFYRPL
ncbi:hypothetical protein OG458_42730 (plasmid) [Streptomyces sp. NBC_01281]|uniref:hypothetical protein n=1 Tax=unclassified Streptomyces TaxID=2593676 RepID=UPI0022562CFE|nr:MULTISPECIES: hypothetical protein [unclassified Streptomyces]MCX4920274.1 hypothetical protein [Streptomyces sp. NBC_00687]WSD82775.1 hypothetical protein OHB33_41045 [Streptomyces sp. NBC_01558]WSK66678.1 hypothetical protein OG458_42730 [Streptomyces sp. NBC_01281]